VAHNKNCSKLIWILVKHTPEELAHWKEHPEDYLKYRHKIEKSVNGAALITVFGTPTQNEFKLINQEAMRKKLLKKPEIMEALEPNWPPGCRRLTPGPGYLEALCEDNVNFINTKIKRFTKEGIETVDGREKGRCDRVRNRLRHDTQATHAHTRRKRHFTQRSLGSGPRMLFWYLTTKDAKHVQIFGPERRTWYRWTCASR
jgi:cation diffusion facilitator CzcD-associated flavoprotein CzcO